MTIVVHTQPLCHTLVNNCECTHTTNIHVLITHKSQLSTRTCCKFERMLTHVNTRAQSLQTNNHHGAVITQCNELLAICFVMLIHCDICYTQALMMTWVTIANTYQPL